MELDIIRYINVRLRFDYVGATSTIVMIDKNILTISFDINDMLIKRHIKKRNKVHKYTEIFTSSICMVYSIPGKYSELYLVGETVPSKEC